MPVHESEPVPKLRVGKIHMQDIVLRFPESQCLYENRPQRLVLLLEKQKPPINELADQKISQKAIARCSDFPH